MDKVKILLVGSAFSADLHMDAYARFRDDVEIVAICSKDFDQANALAARYGFTGYELYDDYNEAIEKADCCAVDICVPNFLHYEVCMKALGADRSVICEKPLATKVEHAREMVAKANEAGRYIYYAEDWLFAPALLRAKAVLDEGAIGNLTYIRARECHGGSHSPFAQTVAFCGGGCMIHLGIHPIGYVMALKDYKWAELTAMTSGGGEYNIRHKKLEGEDWSGVFIRFEDGTTALIEANYLTIGGMDDIVDFYGDKGRMHVDLVASSAVSCFSIPGVSYTVEKAEITTGWSRPAVDEKQNLGYVGEIGHFLDGIRHDKPADKGLRGEDGLALLEFVTYAYQSAREGVSIKNPKSAAAGGA